MYGTSLRFPLLPPEQSEQSGDEVPGAPSAATLVKLKLRPPNTFLIVGLKRRKVVFGSSGGWGIAPLTWSHLPYLHDKSWSQDEPQAPGSFFSHLFISLPTSLPLHQRRGTKSCYQFKLSLTHSLENRTGNCLCARHMSPNDTLPPESRQRAGIRQ